MGMLPPRWVSTATACQERGWSKQRLLHELRNGLPNRTVPEGHTGLEACCARAASGHAAAPARSVMNSRLLS